MKFQPRKIIYPTIILAIAVLAVFLTIRLIGFMSESINAIFTTDSNMASQPIKIDTANYQLVAKKIGITE